MQRVTQILILCLLTSCGTTVEPEPESGSIPNLITGGEENRLESQAQYRSDPDLHLQFLYPDDLTRGELRPAIVFFFGGGWITGTPKAFEMQGKYFASKGYVAILADYRVKDRFGTGPVACVEDAKSVMRFLKTHAQRFNIQAQQIIACGGSAGGHLAAATAFVEGLDAENDDLSVSPVPAALVLFNPVFNNAPTTEGGWGYSLIADYYPQISPYHNINEKAPPTLILLGTEDKLVPVSTALAYVERMEEVGARCELELYDGAGHGFFNYNYAENPTMSPIYYKQTLTRMETFLESLGYMQQN